VTSAAFIEADEPADDLCSPCGVRRNDAMRRLSRIVGAAVVLLAGGVWAVAEADSPIGTSDRSTAQVTKIVRATRFYGPGPSADYDFDNGNIGTVSALRTTFPAGATYDVVVTISMDYRTSADDGFIVGLWARRGSEYGHRVPVLPSARAISASTGRTSTSAIFRLSDLRGGREYWFSPTVNVSKRVGNHASIWSRHVLLVVDATPLT
jgi:hypothetical protein